MGNPNKYSTIFNSQEDHIEETEGGLALFGIFLDVDAKCELRPLHTQDQTKRETFPAVKLKSTRQLYGDSHGLG